MGKTGGASSAPSNTDHERQKEPAAGRVPSADTLPHTGPAPGRHVPSAFLRAFLAVFLGRFQYGDLHFGQTRGSPAVSCFGTHVWPHRSQRQPLRVIFAII